ncbi:MAG: endolytic transglycosylase MltG, partial [Methylophilaceae bacterium]|nr:endolytic transglycosylase MltG [Methylophilaceae bacterium]
MRLINRLVFLTLFITLLFVGWMVYFSSTPITLEEEVMEFDIRAGSSLRKISEQLVDQGALKESLSFMVLVRLMGKAGEVKAGNYLIENGTTPYDLFVTITSGKTTQASITFIEGWTFQQMRDVMMKNESIKHITIAYTDEQILENIGATETHPEGLFFPDTYFF